MSTPISRGAKKKYPNAHITYAVPSDYAGGDLVALLEHIPYIDEVIDYKLVNRDDYDAFTDITRVGLSDEKPYSTPPNRIDLFARASGIPLFNNFLPIYVITEEERKWGKEFVEKAINRRKYKGLISLHLGSRDPKRCWPHHCIRNFVDLARRSDYFVFLYEWGASPDNWRLSGSCRVFDYKMRAAASILAATDVIVCPDSSMLHLAGALNMRIVSLFGSMPPSSRINHYPNATAVVNQQISCLGCVYASCSNNYYCMSSLLPEAVLVAIERSLQKKIIEPEADTKDTIIHSDFTKRRKIRTFTI
jgi:ADP-heptose:LPS heptosyltransferase